MSKRDAMKGGIGPHGRYHVIKVAVWLGRSGGYYCEVCRYRLSVRGNRYIHQAHQVPAGSGLGSE